MRAYSSFLVWPVLALAGWLCAVPLTHARAIDGNPPPEDASTGSGSCQRTYPDPQPDVIDSTYVASVIEQTPDPVDIAIFSHDHDAIHMIVEKWVNYPPDQAWVILTNDVSWEKELAGVNRNDCRDSMVARVPGGHTMGWVTITTADTTWIELRKPKLGLTGIYWDTPLRFTEKDFWRAFGGRKVTFVWKQD